MKTPSKFPQKIGNFDVNVSSGFFSVLYFDVCFSRDRGEEIPGSLKYISPNLEYLFYPLPSCGKLNFRMSHGAVKGGIRKNYFLIDFSHKN